MEHWLYILILSLSFGKILGGLIIDKMECKSENPEFGKFTICELKSVNKTHTIIRTRYESQEVTYAQLTSTLYKRSNGSWKPFLYNITIECCEFMKNPKKYPVESFVYGYIKDYTNFNHTCPYKEAIVDNLSNAHFYQVFRTLPISPGQYALFLVFNMMNKDSIQVRFYGTVTAARK